MKKITLLLLLICLSLTSAAANLNRRSHDPGQSRTIIIYDTDRHDPGQSRP